MEVDLTDSEADEGHAHYYSSSRMSEKFFNREPSDWFCYVFTYIFWFKMLSCLFVYKLSIMWIEMEFFWYCIHIIIGVVCTVSYGGRDYYYLLLFHHYMQMEQNL